MVTVKARAHRALRHLEMYSSADDDPNLSPPPDLGTDEEMIGEYQNSDDHGGDRIVITSRALHIKTVNGWATVHYHAIKPELPPWTKSQRELKLDLIDGSTFSVPVRGGAGKLRDFLVFLTFIKHVLADRDQGFAQ